MSLRLRLAILLTAVLGVALLAFGAGAQFAVDHFAREAMSRALAQEAHQLITAHGPQRDSIAQDDPEMGAARLARVEMFQPGCPPIRIAGHLRRLVDAGAVLPLSEAGLDALQRGQPWIEITALSEFEGDLHMIYNQPIIENERWVGLAQIARSMADHHHSLRTLRDGLLLAGGLAMATAFGLMWLLTGRALHPLARITAALQTMRTSHDFDHSLRQEARRSDEVGRLAAALDAALEALRSAHRQAERALAAQQAVMADVSHELRTPLTTVRGNLGLLQLAPSLSEAERDAVLRDAVDEIERMSRLVNKLLSLANLDANRAPELPLSAVALTPLITAATRQAMSLAPGCAIFLGRTLRSADSCEDIVAIGNADALHQVLMILLDNAIKFTPPEGHIVLDLNADEDMAHIHVRDTGVGIPFEDQPHIFDRFYRAENREVAPSVRGYGLGLAIAKSLVEAQGGTIRVVSEPGRGSTFTVSLRLAHGHRPSDRLA
jgi:two-component system OmpR family sensor kinase